MQPLVLASTSRYRRRLLERLGLPFACLGPRVDEDATKRRGAAPAAIAVELARRKALDGQEQRPDAAVIGSDQVAAVAGRILDKPGTIERARAQLGALQGQVHELITTVAIAHPSGLVEFVDRTLLHMRRLTPAEIERYVTADSPLDCAGSYKIEALGVALFERIECADQTAIVGLPLLRLAAELRQLGFPVP